MPGNTGATGPAGPQGSEGSLRFFVPLLVRSTHYVNPPVGGSEVVSNGGSRFQLDLTTASNMVGEVIFSTIPSAAGVARFEYSTNAGLSWATFLDMGTIYFADTLKLSPVTAVPAGAKVSNCLLRVVVTGNSSTDPDLEKAAIMFQP